MMTAQKEISASQRAVELDSYLNPHKEVIQARQQSKYNQKLITYCSRHDYFINMLKKIDECEGSLDAFSRGFERFGFTIEAGGIRYREWAPGAIEASLIGDFSKSIVRVSF
jgi:hypothetical protein